MNRLEYIPKSWCNLITNMVLSNSNTRAMFNLFLLQFNHFKHRGRALLKLILDTMVEKVIELNRLNFLKFEINYAFKYESNYTEKSIENYYKKIKI